MKKKSIILFVFLSVLAMVTMVGCKKKTDEQRIKNAITSFSKEKGYTSKIELNVGAKVKSEQKDADLRIAAKGDMQYDGKTKTSKIVSTLSFANFMNINYDVYTQDTDTESIVYTNSNGEWSKTVVEKADMENTKKLLTEFLDKKIPLFKKSEYTGETAATYVSNLGNFSNKDYTCYELNLTGEEVIDLCTELAKSTDNDIVADEKETLLEEAEKSKKELKEAGITKTINVYLVLDKKDNLMNLLVDASTFTEELIVASKNESKTETESESESPDIISGLIGEDAGLSNFSMILSLSFSGHGENIDIAISEEAKNAKVKE